MDFITDMRPTYYLQYGGDNSYINLAGLSIWIDGSLLPPHPKYPQFYFFS